MLQTARANPAASNFPVREPHAALTIDVDRMFCTTKPLDKGPKDTEVPAAAALLQEAPESR